MEFTSTRRALPRSAWLAVLAALLGMGLLEHQSGSFSLPSLHASDLPAVGASLFSALQIFRSESLTRRFDPLHLSAVQATVLAVLGLGWEACHVISHMGGTGITGDISSMAAAAATAAAAAAATTGAAASAADAAPPASDALVDLWLQLQSLPWGPLLYGGAVCSGVCTWVELCGLRSVPASTAMLAYTTIPIWGALFSFLLRGDMPAPPAVVGGGFIVAVSLAAQALMVRGSLTARAAGREGGGDALSSSSSSSNRGSSSSESENVLSSDGTDAVLECGKVCLQSGSLPQKAPGPAAEGAEGAGGGSGSESEGQPSKEAEGKTAEGLSVALLSSQLKFPFYAAQAKQMLVKLKVKLGALKALAVTVPASTSMLGGGTSGPGVAVSLPSSSSMGMTGSYGGGGSGVGALGSSGGASATSAGHHHHHLSSGSATIPTWDRANPIHHPSRDPAPHLSSASHISPHPHSGVSLHIGDAVSSSSSAVHASLPAHDVVTSAAHVAASSAAPAAATATATAASAAASATATATATAAATASSSIASLSSSATCTPVSASLQLSSSAAGNVPNSSFPTAAVPTSAAAGVGSGAPSASPTPPALAFPTQHLEASDAASPIGLTAVSGLGNTAVTMGPAGHGGSVAGAASATSAAGGVTAGVGGTVGGSVSTGATGMAGSFGSSPPSSAPSLPVATSSGSSTTTPPAVSHPSSTHPSLSQQTSSTFPASTSPPVEGDTSYLMHGSPSSSVDASSMANSSVVTAPPSSPAPSLTAAAHGHVPLPHSPLTPPVHPPAAAVDALTAGHSVQADITALGSAAIDKAIMLLDHASNAVTTSVLAAGSAGAQTAQALSDASAHAAHVTSAAAASASASASLMSMISHGLAPDVSHAVEMLLRSALC